MNVVIEIVEMTVVAVTKAVVVVTKAVVAEMNAAENVLLVKLKLTVPMLIGRHID